MTAEHQYDDPVLSSKEFLYAVMRDPTLPLEQRMDAAVKLLPFEVEIPAYHGEFPASRTVVLTIRLAPWPEHVSHEVGFGEREEVAA